MAQCLIATPAVAIACFERNRPDGSDFQRAREGKEEERQHVTDNPESEPTAPGKPGKPADPVDVPPTPPDEPAPVPVQDPPAEPVEPPYVVA
jgi:hypothetical protein